MLIFDALARGGTPKPESLEVVEGVSEVRDLTYDLSARLCPIKNIRKVPRSLVWLW